MQGNIGTLNVHKSEKFNILVKKNNKLFELFKIVFYTNSNNQFAIFVTFPFFLKNQGILSSLTIPANQQTVKKLSLVPTGNLTNHLVKYTHWEDGNAHFSQDKQVLTTIKKMSAPLSTDPGHLFSIQLQGLGGFKNRTISQKKYGNKAVDIEFAINDKLEALKFTGWWVDSTHVTQNKQVIGPVVSMQINDRSYKTGFALAPIKPKYPNHFFLIAAEKIPYLNKNKHSLLSFAGGFDTNKTLKDDFSFLSFIYPTAGYNKLARSVPTVDYVI